MRRSDTRKLGTKRREFSQFSKLPNSFESWNQKPFMNSLICAKSESFACSLCASFKLQVFAVRKCSIMLTIPVTFDSGSFHVISNKSNSIPSTVPFVPTSKDFSRIGQSLPKAAPVVGKLRHICPRNSALNHDRFQDRIENRRSRFASENGCEIIEIFP